MNAAASAGANLGEDPQAPPGGNHVFSAPLARLKTGRLVLASEIVWMRLAADPRVSCLYQARIRGSAPGVRVQGNTVTLDPGPLHPHPAAVRSNRPLVEIRLNCAIPWEIEFRQGVSHLDADLRQLELRSLDILGSTGHSRLALPQPSGSLYLYISGNTHHCTFLAHPGSEVKLQIGRGATDLVFDHQRYDVLEGETNLVSHGFNSASRYELYLAAVNSLVIRSSKD